MGDDTDSVTASAADHSFVRLSTFYFFLIVIPSLVLCPPFRFLQGYGFELLLACPDPRGSSRPHFRLFPRVAEDMLTARVRAATLSRN